MKVKTEDLARKAAILLGEMPSAMCNGVECEAATLTDYLLTRIEQLAPEAVTDTPAELVDNYKPLEGNGITTMEDGSALLPLPDDFLRLHFLRIEGWARPVTGCYLPESLPAALQSCRCPSLRASASRPVAVLTPADGGRALRLYGSHSEPAKIAEGWYLPIPRIDADGFIDMPEASIPILLNRLKD